MGLTWEGSVHWNDEAWRERAAFRHSGPGLFFPIGDTGPSVADVVEAEVWGGTPEEERRQLRKRGAVKRRPAS